MPYKDPTIRREKARQYQAAHRARQKQAMPVVMGVRFCCVCNTDISHMRSDAKFCSRSHKSIFNDSNRDYAAEYANNVGVRRANALKYYHQDVEISRAKQRMRQKQNLHIFAANQAARRAAKLERTPKWLDAAACAELDFTYEYCAALRKCGLDYHVDHVVPLQGNLVSGLHVPWNLQVIHAQDNIAKNNRFEVV